MYEYLKKVDKEVYEILNAELKRQQDTINLIPSENYASLEVLSAAGNILSNKYAEGYPDKRWYQGCRFADEIEELAKNRGISLFGGEHINVQPHSGAQANMAVYLALLEKGDKILAMSLDQGGHLTHGTPQNLSGKIYQSYFYGVDKETETIDYDEVLKIALKCKPKLIICGASSYPRTIDFSKFREIADKVGAYLMADIAHIAGLISAKLHPNPVPFCDVVTSTTHKTLRGPRGGFIICKSKLARKIDQAVFPGIQGGPLMNIIAAKAVGFAEAKTHSFINYQKDIVNNAKVMSSEFKKRGFRLVSGGTDIHLMLIDLKPQHLTGQEAAQILEKCSIIVNKNSIPYDDKPPAIASGIRVGTPAITSRGMKEEEMKIIAQIIKEILSNPNSLSVQNKSKDMVLELCTKFPIYGVK